LGKDQKKDKQKGISKKVNYSIFLFSFTCFCIVKLIFRLSRTKTKRCQWTTGCQRKVDITFIDGNFGVIMTHVFSFRQLPPQTQQRTEGKARKLQWRKLTEKELVELLIKTYGNLDHNRTH
jgi:hypothetical protein